MTPRENSAISGLRAAGQREKRGQGKVIPGRAALPSLSEMGISTQQASAWMQLAGVDPEEFEKRMPTETKKGTAS